MMSHWQPQPLQYSNDAARMSLDNTRDQSKQILSREKREMLVHYFSHRDATSMSQQRHPIRQEHDEFGLVRRHQSTPHMIPSSEWSTDYYPPVESEVIRRRHHTGGQDRTLSVGMQMSDPYGGDSRLHGNRKNDLHYKSCNMIGSDSSAHGNIDQQLYPAKSIHHIPDSSNSNYRKEKYSSPNLAISSQGLEYICNFKSTPHHPHKVSNQINECLMHTRSAQDLRTVSLHGNRHGTVQSATQPFSKTAGDHKSSHRRRRKNKNCSIM